MDRVSPEIILCRELLYGIIIYSIATRVRMIYICTIYDVQRGSILNFCCVMGTTNLSQLPPRISMTDNS